MSSLPQIAPEMENNTDTTQQNEHSVMEIEIKKIKEKEDAEKIKGRNARSNSFFGKQLNWRHLDGQEVGVVKQGTTFSNWMLYHIENQIAAFPNFAFFLIGLLFIFCYLVFGFIWYVIGANTNDESTVFGTTNLNDALYFSLQMLTAAGYDDSIPSGNGLRSVSFLMIATGLVVFAILVGFITDAVTTYMDSLKVGSTDVEEEGHTIILGWNEATARSLVQMSFLRRQYQMANEEKFCLLRYIPEMFTFWRPLPPSTSIAANDIVILCNSKSKDEMHSIVKNTFHERGISSKRTCLGRNIVCRCGDPTDINDLLRVGLHKASAILVQLTEEDLGEEDTSQGIVKNGITLRTALAIRNTILSNLKNQKVKDDLRIILQLSKPSNYIDAISIKNGEKECFISLEMSLFLNIWLFKSAIRPRLVQTLMDILNFEGIAIRRRKAKNLRSGPLQEAGHCIGQTFEDLQMEFAQAILLGVVRPSKNTEQDIADNDLGLLCNPQTIIEDDDLLMFLDTTATPVCTTEGITEVRKDKEEAMKLLENFTPHRHPILKTKQRIMFCGWRSAWALDSRRLKQRIEETAQYCLKGSIFIFVNFVSFENFESIMQEIDITKTEKSLGDISAEYGTESTLQSPGANTFHSVRSQIYEIGSTGIFVQHVEGDAASRSVLESLLDAHQNEINTAVIMGTQALEGDPTQLIDVPPTSQDTRVLCLILLLRKLCTEREGFMKPIHIVAENQEDATAKLALPPRGKGIKPDFVNCQAIYARTLVQTLAYPVIQQSISELFSEKPNSCNLEKMTAANFVPLRQKVRFGVVQQLVQHQMTYPDMRFICIGQIFDNTTVDLMPSDETVLEYDENDYLIVFCRSKDRHKNS